MEEALSAEKGSYEPRLGFAKVDAWRLRTNFADPKRILERFPVWPDEVLDADALETLYSLKGQDLAPGFSVRRGREVAPAFPFLDEEVGASIARVWANHVDALFAPLHTALSDIRQARTARGRHDGAHGPHALSGAAALILQTLLALRLREEERRLDLWRERSDGQKLGAVYAARAVDSPFTVVQAIPVKEDTVVAAPWGGPFSEYGKLLHLLENRYTRGVLGSYDEDREIVPEGHVLHRMTAIGLLIVSRRAFMDSHWKLTVPVLAPSDAEHALGRLADAVDEGCRGVGPALLELKEGMKNSRYAYLDGHGDYFEMAYAVLLGMLLQQGIEKGALAAPPGFNLSGDYATALRGMRERLKGVYPDLYGICVIEGSGHLWEACLSHFKSGV